MRTLTINFGVILKFERNMPRMLTIISTTLPVAYVHGPCRDDLRRVDSGCPVCVPLCTCMPHCKTTRMLSWAMAGQYETMC